MPPLSSTSSLLVTVRDVDDMSPKFTHSVYKIQIDEDFPITGEQELRLIQFTHPVLAVDQDAAVKSEINYQITGGNEIFSKYYSAKL